MAETDINGADEWQIESTETPEEDEVDRLVYEISHYPADITLEGYNSRFQKSQLAIPRFQRNYVWDLVRASKLIESFLLGLPIPGVFLYKERSTNKLLIIDGLQRVFTAIKFFSGQFDEKRLFRLKGVRENWEGKLYTDLSESERNILDDSVLRATIIQQIDPLDDSSIYHIFERLNTGGMKLSPMEVRKCVYDSRAFSLLEELNEDNNWRLILGKQKPDNRMRDSELILRFLSLRDDWVNYEKPMKNHLNKYMADKRKLTTEETDKYIDYERIEFVDLTKYLVEMLGEKPFHLRGRLNYAAMDAVMVGAFFAKSENISNLKARVDELYSDENFIPLVTANTSDESILKARIAMAIKKLSGQS